MNAKPWNRNGRAIPATQRNNPPRSVSRALVHHQPECPERKQQASAVPGRAGRAEASEQSTIQPADHAGAAAAAHGLRFGDMPMACPTETLRPSGASKMNPTAPLPWARRQPFHPRFRLTGGRRRPISRAVLALLPPIRLARPPTPPSLPCRRAVESARPPICVTRSPWWTSSARRPTPLPPPPPSASKCGATRGPPCREDCAADASTPSDNELRLDWLPRLHITLLPVLRRRGARAGRA